ncbi:hypothetical protein DFJ77DRAFT_169645 [Powellomyces hirtus]|nr:hypothetical protein DFJ77DRAFT_169645 [Powellomyces hirtus]
MDDYTPLIAVLPPEIWRHILSMLPPSFLRLIARRVSRSWDQITRGLMPRLLAEMELYLVVWFDNTWEWECQHVRLKCAAHTKDTLFFDQVEKKWWRYQPRLVTIESGFHNLWHGVHFCLGDSEPNAVVSSVRINALEDAQSHLQECPPLILRYSTRCEVDGRENVYEIYFEQIVVKIEDLLAWKGRRNIDRSRSEALMSYEQIQEAERLAKLCDICKRNNKGTECLEKNCKPCCRASHHCFSLWQTKSKSKMCTSCRKNTTASKSEEEKCGNCCRAFLCQGHVVMKRSAKRIVTGAHT